LLAVALGMAAVAPEGGEVAGIEVEGSRVLIVDAENGDREIHRRVHGLGLKLEHVSRLEIVEARGFHLFRDLGALQDRVGTFGPDLMILDGFRSLWPDGDENSSEDVTPVLAALRDLARDRQVGTLLIHHSPKGGQTYRGSSAIAAGIELAFILERIEGDDDRQRRRLRCEKCRPAPEPESRWLRLAAADELALGAGLLQQADPFTEPRVERAPARSRLTADVLQVLGSRGPMERADIARAVGRDPSDGTLRRAVKTAASAAELVQLEDGRYALASPPANSAGKPQESAATLSGPLGDVAGGKPRPLHSEAA
jgi:hypothetical protein